MPGSFTSSDSLFGTTPSYSSTRAWPSLITLLVLARKNPVGLRIASISSRSASAYACAVGYLAKRVGVTLFTVTSVVWADRMVATSNSSGVVKSSSQCASG